MYPNNAFEGVVTIIRKFLSAILAGLTVFAAGCSGAESAAPEPTAPLTAEALYGEMVTALSATPPTSGSGEGELLLTVDAGLFSLDAGVSAAAEALLGNEPFELYATGKLTAALPGLDLSRDLQIYAGEKDIYCHMDAADLWLRLAAGTGAFEVRPVDLTLEEQPSGYILRGALIIEKPEALSGTELRGQCHVDKETCLPTMIQLKTAEIPDGAQDYVNQISERAGLGLSAEVTSLRITVAELGYDPKEVPGVPPEGIDAAREFSGLTGKDLLKLLK